ncbi:hypothetical protein QJQ45_016425 [Haematococcus lacustris]|nr:hypothetical protein QJQ45_016425 [Haematococcus lacustris]
MGDDTTHLLHKVVGLVRLFIASSMQPITLSDVSDVLDQHLLPKLERVLHAAQFKAQRAVKELAVSEDETAVVASRLVQVRSEKNVLQERERNLHTQVGRLEALMETERLRHSLSETKLQQQLDEERRRAERFRALREDAVLQREDTLADLASAYAEMEAMQSTLADSAIYVRYLRKKVLELELQNSRQAAQSASQPSKGVDGAGVLCLNNIRKQITAAVQEAYSCDEDEKRKKLRQLQLRWHPDKNPVLTEFATEVTKLINEALAEAEKQS